MRESYCDCVEWVKLTIPPSMMPFKGMQQIKAYKEAELEKKSTCKEYLHVQYEGKGKVSRVVKYIFSIVKMAQNVLLTTHS